MCVQLAPPHWVLAFPSTPRDACPFQPILDCVADFLRVRYTENIMIEIVREHSQACIVQWCLNIVSQYAAKELYDLTYCRFSWARIGDWSWCTFFWNKNLVRCVEMFLLDY